MSGDGAGVRLPSSSPSCPVRGQIVSAGGGGARLRSPYRPIEHHPHGRSSLRVSRDVCWKSSIRRLRAERANDSSFARDTASWCDLLDHSGKLANHTPGNRRKIKSTNDFYLPWGPLLVFMEVQKTIRPGSGSACLLIRPTLLETTRVESRRRLPIRFREDPGKHVLDLAAGNVLACGVTNHIIGEISLPV